ncbi:DUF4861 domain-containing protein [Bacteroides fluxus]|jgi:hypothetical protein|uniref:DUF4861 domain-containing protein n=1 Tax=Bacteroides fluxus YIT 12057 TaxID=763034 RepID=F3PTE1_9BACE|nr:DUF4861 domain-containing protein [Bacteroides fluxus]EGF56866.1 hypothetical protein HMPREF9446_02009 [Bacteroides fluxus YIT 12057]MDY3790826.1 DUF4861 domain-containing protein [Bacteroides fluxus]
MKKNIFILLCLLCGLPLSIFAQQTVQLTVEVGNQWKTDKTDAPVVIRLNEVNPGFRVRSAVVMNGNEEIASQLDDLDGDLKADELAFVINVPAQSKKVLTVTLSSEKTGKTYPARVFAEMLVRDAKKQKHAPAQSITVPGTTNFYNMVQHHGPAFESELVGYRIYFNQKQTVDPYGKFNKGLEIEESQFYPTKAQLERGFGDDVLMVGNSCGIGTLKGWDGAKATHIEPVAFRTERILAYGPIRTVTEVEVKGWEYQGKELNMTNRYILYAGHRDLLVETFFDEPLTDEVFCTGVQNIMGNETLSHSDHHGLVGSWGRHWPVTDTVKYAKETVGIATYIPQKYVRKEVKDKDNFLYTVSAPGCKHFHYYTMFTSRKETFGYPTPETWFAYMQEWKEELEHPVTVKIKP